MNGIKHFENIVGLKKLKEGIYQFLAHSYSYMFRLLEGNIFLRSKIYTYVMQYK